MKSKAIAVALAAMLTVVGGAAAVTSTGSMNAQAATDGDVDAMYDNGTVSLTVTNDAEAVENASVYVDDEQVGTTDANGTLTFEHTNEEELELEIVSEEFTAEQEYVIENGSLVLLEEEFEYESEDESDESEQEPNEHADDEAEDKGENADDEDAEANDEAHEAEQADEHENENGDHAADELDDESDDSDEADDEAESSANGEANANAEASANADETASANAGAGASVTAGVNAVVSLFA